MIVPIDAKDVSRITSGQVIVELTSAVKELVDNAIDAGADKIEVKFAEYGVKLLEVSDNGAGIDPADYDALCLKYHTSKLSTYDDLSTVLSLGFRGEAMSSLCSVATICVDTCSASTFPRAALLLYDHMGKLTGKKTMVTGRKGTTVRMTDLFRAFPVRYKTFVKHAKREYSKALALVMAYSLGYTNIRFTVFSIGANGKRQMVMGTPGGLAPLNDVMLNVYGSNGAYGLVPLAIAADNLEARFKLYAECNPTTLSFRLVGAISDCSFGLGRAGTDRQFLSINKRPVAHKRLSKIINEVYRSFNTLQSPTFVLDLQIDPQFLDVNITPDKRSVMIHAEEVIFDAIREKLTAFYDGRHNVVPKSVHTLHMGSSQISKMPVDKGGLESRVKQRDSLGSCLERKNVPVSLAQDKDRPGSPEDQNEPGSCVKSNSESWQTEPPVQVTVIDDNFFVSPDDLQEQGPEKDTFLSGDCAVSTDVLQVLGIEPPSPLEDQDQKSFGVPSRDLNGEIGIQCQVDCSEEAGDSKHNEDMPSDLVLSLPPADMASGHSHPSAAIEDPGFALESKNLPPPSQPKNRTQSSETHVAQPHVLAKKSRLAADTALYSLRQEYKVSPSDQKVTKQTQETKKTELVAVGNIAQTMEINKRDFLEMSLVGQFNSGFIIVTHQNRLFIVDQHALDEIYNYERLMKSLVLRAQPLVIPRTLELSPIDEIRMLECSEQLRRNGFQIEEDEVAPPGRKVRLVAVAVLKNVVFDDSDLHELVNKTHEYCSLEKRGVMAAVRCTKTERTIALRACRLSIMIGLALLKSTMNRVVRHLSTLDRPWNCPHGRPTFRHLADLEGEGFQEDYEV